MRAGFRSMSQRYPRDFSHALQRRHPGTLDGATLSQEWASLPASPGIEAAAWLGHCTTLLRIAGKTVLTDPVLSPRVGMKLWRVKLGPSRLSPLPVLTEQLPPIDLILISHAHFDHLDKDTLRQLVRPSTEVITARHTRRLIPKGFGGVRELDWDSSLNFHGIAINAIRPNHWGARTGWDRHRGFNAYLLESAGEKAIFAGDTAHTTAFDNLGPIDLGIFGIGAYEPWHHAHATPEQVWSMIEKSATRRVLPVHHSTFKLSDEPIHEPLDRLLAAAGSEKSRVLDASLGSVLRLKN